MCPARAHWGRGVDTCYGRPSGFLKEKRAGHGSRLPESGFGMPQRRDRSLFCDSPMTAGAPPLHADLYSRIRHVAGALHCQRETATVDSLRFHCRRWRPPNEQTATVPAAERSNKEERKKPTAHAVTNELLCKNGGTSDRYASSPLKPLHFSNLQGNCPTVTGRRNVRFPGGPPIMHR